MRKSWSARKEETVKILGVAAETRDNQNIVGQAEVSVNFLPTSEIEGEYLGMEQREVASALV